MLDTVESRGTIKRGSRPFFRVTRWWLGISAIVLILTSAESAASHAECATAGPDWPSPGSFWTVEETRTGSFGNGSARVTLLFLGERPWKGELHLAISDGSDVVYFDRAHRLVARERDGAVLVAYEPPDPVVSFPLFVGRRWPTHLYHVIPMHCSEAGFVRAMQRDLPDRLILSYLGTRYIFGA